MLTFEYTTTPEHIREIEDRVLAVAVERGAVDLRQGRILLVLDEILTNIRLYAYPDGPGPVRVEILPPRGEDDALLHLEINDWGPPFDPLNEAPSPSLTHELDGRPIGGLGLYLVNNVVCGIAYSRKHELLPSKGRNQLRISFPLR